MPKIHHKRNRRTKAKSRKGSRQNRRRSRNIRHLAKLLGGGCGCGAAAAVSPSSPSSASSSASLYGGAAPLSSQPMKGGFAPSFSGLQESKFYPLNNFENDPTMMAAGSRQMSGVEIGMNKTVGGGRRKKSSKRQRKTMKKMRGGIALGGLLSAASGTLLGDGMADNVIANQGGISGNVSAYQIMSGNHSPTTSVSQPLSTLYHSSHRPLV